MKPLQPYSEERPWGDFVRFTENEPSTVKIITIKKGQELSLQYHERRSEFWRVLSGVAEITIGEASPLTAKAGDDFYIPVKTKHRIAAPETLGHDAGVQILEIAFGDFDEDDIVRLADRYGRVEANGN